MIAPDTVAVSVLARNQQSTLALIEEFTSDSKLPKIVSAILQGSIDVPSVGMRDGISIDVARYRVTTDIVCGCVDGGWIHRD